MSFYQSKIRLTSNKFRGRSAACWGGKRNVLPEKAHFKGFPLPRTPCIDLPSYYKPAATRLCFTHHPPRFALQPSQSCMCSCWEAHQIICPSPDLVAQPDTRYQVVSRVSVQMCAGVCLCARVRAHALLKNDMSSPGKREQLRRGHREKVRQKKRWKGRVFFYISSLIDKKGKWQKSKRNSRLY